MPHRLRLLALLLSLLAATGLAKETEVIELGHVLPEDVIPALEPLLQPDDSLSVFRNSLVVTADQDTLTRLKGLVAELDRPLRNLLISIRRGGDTVTEGGGVSAGGTISTDGNSRVQVQTSRRASTRARGGEQSLRTLEGRRVLIADGQLVPVATSTYWGTGVGYADVQQGMVVSARVVGDRVVLSVSARNDEAQGGRIRTGELETEVSAQLGEWIYLGGVARASSRDATGIATRYGTRGSANESIEVRVELLD